MRAAVVDPVMDPVGGVGAAPLPRWAVLRRRAEFLRAARAFRQAPPGLLLQGRPRGAQEPAEAEIRIGFTCSKKIGNAVVRNRAKRRLRAAAREVLPAEGRAGWDYVLIGRPGATVTRGFADLVADLRGALAKVHKAADKAERGAPAEGDRTPRRAGA